MALEPTPPVDHTTPPQASRGSSRRDIERLTVERTGLGQLVVMLVLGMIVSVASVSLAVVRYFALGANPAPIHAVQVGPWTTYVSQQMPVTELVIVALLGMAAVAAAAVALEVGTTIVLSLNPRRRNLAAYRHIRAGSLEGIEPVRVTVVIPAHNEEDTLPATLDGLMRQTRLADRIIVVADNSTDRTVEIARERGVEVFETVSNWKKKAGALNQALSVILRDKGPSDAILLMDADTVLTERFIEAAAAQMDEDPELAAIGARFTGAEGAGVIGQFQRNEFLRYSAQISARRGRVFVLTGTATMFRADALLDIAAARGVYIPGESGQVYDTAALTEDNEITLALKSLGGEMISPDDCGDITEIMPTCGIACRHHSDRPVSTLCIHAAEGVWCSPPRPAPPRPAPPRPAQHPWPRPGPGPAPAGPGASPGPRLLSSRPPRYTVVICSGRGATPHRR